MAPKNIWLPKKTKDYKIKVKGNEKETVTVGLTVTATGEKMEPLIIFCAAEHGRIYKNECLPNN